MKNDLQEEMKAYLGNPENSLQDEMSAYLEEEKLKKNQALSEESYPNTIEGKYLQPVYNVAEPVGKALSILEKPVSLAMGTGRSIGKLVSGQENPGGPIMEELKSPFPTPAGSLTADFTEAGIGSSPIVGNVLPDVVRQEFPKASSVVENVSPNNLIDMAASAAYGSKVPEMAGEELAKSTKYGLENAKKALIRGSEKDLKYVGELQSSGKMDSLAQKVVSDKLIRRNLNNPEKMVEYLQGLKSEFTDPVTGKRSKNVVIPGKIDSIGAELGKKIKELSRKTSEKPISVNSFISDLTNEIVDETNKIGSGTDFSPNKIKAEISKYLKQPSQASLEFDMHGPATIDVEDLVNIKRGAADKLYDIKTVTADYDKTSLSKMIADKLWKKADKDIFDFANKSGDYSIVGLNNEYSDYQKIRELYANKDIAAKHIPTLIEQAIPAVAVGTGIGAATGSPYMGILAAGAYPAARNSVSALSEKLPATTLNTRINMINPALKAISSVNPIASSIATVRLPMSSQAAMQNPELVYAKIEREFGPQQAEMFRQARSSDEVRAIFRMLHQQNPGIFEQTKYNNIDGYIDPAFKQKAINDIVGDKVSPAHINADKMQLLLHEGKIQP